MSDQADTEGLPSQLVDALLGYAIDPVRWESLATALEIHRNRLAGLEPGALLTALSQAEALAWQLRGQTDARLQQAGCAYFLLDAGLDVVEASVNATELTAYCRLEGKRLRFTDPLSQRSYETGLKHLLEQHQQPVLVELHAPQAVTRYGYLLHAEDLPAAINLQDSGVFCGLLIAHADSAAQTREVLRSSFGLTAAELAVCERLSAGLQLKEVAQALAISTNTARNHLQSIFEKTNVNRQGDLLLMMTQLSVILSVIEAHGEDARAAMHAADYPPHRFAIAAGADAEPRRIAFRQYGDGARHVLFFHESVGTSRLLPGTDKLATRLGLTITAFERPGSGFSDALNHYDFNTVAADAQLLLDQLEIEHTALMGFVSGAAHALAAAALLGDRVDQVLLVAGRGTRGWSYGEAGTLATLRRHLTTQPWMLSTFFNILRSRATRDTNRQLLLRVYGSVPHDKAYLQSHPEVLEHMVDYTLEALTISGAGVAGEIRCFSAPANVELSRITAPVMAWHGAADQVVTFDSLCRELADIDFEQRVFADCGSMILFEYWQEILEHLAQGAGAASG